MAKKKGKKAKAAREKRTEAASDPKDGYGEGGWIRPPKEDVDKGPEDGTLPVKKELAPWKRIGLAVGACIGINAAFLPIIFLPIMGVVIMLMLAPYLGAFVGGRWLKKEWKGEWIGAAVWFVVIWPSVLVLIMLSLLRTFGSFDLVIELYATVILVMVYMFPTIFSLLGFHQGSKTAEERGDNVDSGPRTEDIEAEGPTEERERPLDEVKGPSEGKYDDTSEQEEDDASRNREDDASKKKKDDASKKKEGPSKKEE